MKPRGDIIFGFVGSGATLILDHINLAVGLVTGLVTLSVMALRLRREWLNRNKPPTE